MQQPLEGISTPSKSMSPIFEKSPEVEVEVLEELEEGKFLDIASCLFLECGSRFLKWLDLLGCFLVLLILPDGAI